MSEKFKLLVNSAELYIFYFIFCVQRKKRVHEVIHQFLFVSGEIDRKVLLFDVLRFGISAVLHEVTYRYLFE